jgi:hypothetical protein
MPRSPRLRRTCGPPERFRQNEVYSSRQKKSELVKPPALPTEAQECAKLPDSPDRNALMLLPPLLSPMLSPIPPIPQRLIGASASLPKVDSPSHAHMWWQSPKRVGSGESDSSLTRAGSTELFLRELFPPPQN